MIFLGNKFSDTCINKTNNCLSLQIIEHKKDPLYMDVVGNTGPKLSLI